MKKRVTYRPSKAQAVFGIAASTVFVLIGIFLIIPVFGVFGIFWTIIAAGMNGFNIYHAFGKKYVGPEIHIEDVDDGPAEQPTEQPREPAGNPGAVEARLQSLQSLYEQGLVTQEEYEEKRREILDAL